jgi:hypothetical protein
VRPRPGTARPIHTGSIEMHYRLTLCFTALLAACSGSGDGNGTQDPGLPGDPNLAPVLTGYSDPTASYELGAEIDPNVPQVTGAELTFTVTPALPSGLVLNATTGVITGAPIKASLASQYTIRVVNDHGTATTQVQVGVPTPSMYLNTSRPLVASDASGVLPPAPNFGGLGANQPGSSPQSGTPAQIDAALPTLVDLVFLEDVPGLSFGYVPPYHDAAGDFFAWIVPSYEKLSILAGWSLAAADPYASVPASLLGFGIGKSELVAGEPELSVEIKTPAVSEPLLESAPLPTRRVTVEQLSRDVELHEGWVEVAGQLIGIGEVAPGVTKLFRYDLSTVQLHQVSESAQGGADDAVVLLGQAGGRVFVSMRKAAAGDAVRLFSYDPTTDQLRALTNIQAGDEDPSDLAVSGTQLFFAANQSSGVRKLYRYDQANNRLNQISDTSAGGDDDPRETLVLGDRVYFTALDASGGRHLHAYDLQADVVERLSATAGPAGDDAPASLTELDGVLYLTAALPSGARKLFHLDSETDQLVQAVDIRGDATLSDDPQWLLPYSNDLFFRAQRADGVYKLHRYQPQSDRGELMSNTAGTGNSDDLQELTQIGTHIVFSSLNQQGERELFYFNDATGEVIQPVNNLASASDEPTGMLHLGDGLGVLTMDGPDGERELYFYDSQQRWVSRIADTAAGHDEARAQCVVDGDPYFLALDASGTRSLFRVTR